MEKLAAFEVIRNARAMVKDVNTSASERTLAQYAAAYQRMAKRELAPEKIANTVRSFYFYRAAHVHHFAALVRLELQQADKAQKQNDPKTFVESVQRIERHCLELERYRPDPHGTHLDRGLISKWAVENEKRTKSGFTEKSHSKRARLRGLPADWREQMFAAAADSKYRDALAVLGVTGARPAELERGVMVTINNAQNLVFSIEGVKTHGGKYGQEKRILEIRPDGVEAMHLFAQVREQGEFVVRAAAGALSDRVREFSKRVFPKLKSGVSAYVYRHQFCADLKASGLSGIDVSTAMGHSTDETKRFYGAAQSAKSQANVASVSGSQRVRERTREKMQHLEQSRGRDWGYERTR